MICILVDWLKLTLQTSGDLGREYPRESKRDYFGREERRGGNCKQRVVQGGLWHGSRTDKIEDQRSWI